MQLVILRNARSGRGRAGAWCDALAQRLVSAGHRVSVLDVGPGAGGDDAVSAAAAGADVLVAAGGDGTVHHAAVHAARLQKPLYHAPLGNENLFAREFGMDGRAGTLIGALDRWNIVRADMARLAGAGAGHMVLLCSAGLDASVIHRLAARRTRPSGHVAYTAPMLQELASPCFPTLTVTVDGREIVGGRRGIAIIANCRQYAFHMNPAAGASMTDGVLDLIFLPVQSRAGGVLWALRCLLRRTRGAVSGRGRVIRIESEGNPAPVQVDGEAAGFTTVEATVEPGVLPVLACHRPGAD